MGSHRSGGALKFHKSSCGADANWFGGCSFDFQKSVWAKSLAVIVLVLEGLFLEYARFVTTIQNGGLSQTVDFCGQTDVDIAF